MSAVFDRRSPGPREALAAVEHDIRGVAATLGTIGRLLTDGRLPKAEEPALFERLTRLASRLEALAADAQTLSEWLDVDVVNRVRWQASPIGPLIDAVFGASGITTPSGDGGAWRQSLVRESEDGALERALRTLHDHASHEAHDGVGWLAAPRDGACDVFIGRAGPPPIETRERFDAPRTASLVAALAVLAAHGVSVWRGPGGEGVGLSVPIARPPAQA